VSWGLFFLPIGWILRFVFSFWRAKKEKKKERIQFDKQCQERNETRNVPAGGVLFLVLLSMICRSLPLSFFLLSHLSFFEGGNENEVVSSSFFLTKKQGKRKVAC
jgi:hypothetical protein